MAANNSNNKETVIDNNIDLIDDEDDDGIGCGENDNKSSNSLLAQVKGSKVKGKIQNATNTSSFYAQYNENLSPGKNINGSNQVNPNPNRT